MAEITNPQLRGAVEHLVAQVTPENVLDVRNVLMQEVVRLQMVIKRYDMPSDFATEPADSGLMGTAGSGFRIGRCSDDPVSGPAQVSFNRKIMAIIDNCRAYVADLYSAADTLADIARSYQYSEDEIARSFPRIGLR